jgi:hypothetical protein
MLLLQIRPLTADTLLIKIKGENHAHSIAAQRLLMALFCTQERARRSPLYYLLAARALVRRPLKILWLQNWRFNVLIKKP